MRVSELNGFREYSGFVDRDLGASSTTFVFVNSWENHLLIEDRELLFGDSLYNDSVEQLGAGVVRAPSSEDYSCVVANNAYYKQWLSSSSSEPFWSKHYFESSELKPCYNKDIFRVYSKNKYPPTDASRFPYTLVGTTYDEQTISRVDGAMIHPAIRCMVNLLNGAQCDGTHSISKSDVPENAYKLPFYYYGGDNHDVLMGSLAIGGGGVVIGAGQQTETKLSLETNTPWIMSTGCVLFMIAVAAVLSLFVDQYNRWIAEIVTKYKHIRMFTGMKTA